MLNDRTLSAHLPPVYYIDTFDLKSCFDTLDAAMLKVQMDYEPEAYIYIYKDGADGTEIVYRGYAKNAVTPLEQHIMDAATDALGNRFGGNQ